MLEFHLHGFSIQMLVQFFHAHPYSASIFTYLITFAEAMAVVGMIIPGAIIMPTIGFLIGIAIIPAGSTFAWAILGAVTGDVLSYFLGVYFRDRIHRIWPFTRWPNLLVSSEKFFHNHGGKSVFIGRFVGPTRAMIPMIAGVLKMPITRFMFAALPSAIIWAVGYMVPGILLGALSLELPAKVATQFIIGAFLALVALWLVVWLAQHFFRQIWQIIDYYIMYLWRYLRKSRKLIWLTQFLSDPKAPDNHWQLVLLILVIGLTMLFLWILRQVFVPGFLVDFGHSIYHLLSSLRFGKLDYIFVFITFLGDLPLLLIATIVIFMWFLWKKCWYMAGHWLGIIMFSSIAIAGVKYLVNSSRPGDILYAMQVPSLHSSSFYVPAFPSSHVALCIVFYGFLAVVIARELQTAKKYFAYVVVGILTVLISFSRLYLGAHWLIDVLGGLFFGLILLLIATVSYHRRHVLHLDIREFIFTIISIIVAVWLGYGAISFSQQFDKYNLIWPKQTMVFRDLIKGAKEEVPLYRLNRLGEPIEAFNVIYIGNLAKISQALRALDWEPQPIKLDFQDIIKSFSPTSVAHHLTILPQLYHNKKMSLLFTKNTKQDDKVLILRLWLSDVDLTDSDLPLWIGTIEYHHASPNFFSLKNFKQKHLFVGATEFLARDLGKSGFSLWKKHYLLKQQPLEMRGLHWDGRLLVVKSG